MRDLLIADARQAPDVDRSEQARFVAGQDEQHPRGMHEA
jgi:hypothetical protein